MTTSTTIDVPAGGTSAGGDCRGRTMVAALAITQTIGYGTLYYAFAVLLLAFSRIDSLWQLYAVQIGIGAATGRQPGPSRTPASRGAS